ncbi:unnamed protein product [Lota lota]
MPVLSKLVGIENEKREDAGDQRSSICEDMLIGVARRASGARRGWRADRSRLARLVSELSETGGVAVWV